jgi:glyoxylase-like metal-dependent hydrolase (beta-lactamase superfamily II)
MSYVRLAAVVGSVICISACSQAMSTQRLAEEAIEAAGGAERLRAIRVLAMKGGTGTRLRLGQLVKLGEPEQPATLTNVVETVDFANGRAALDYQLRNGDFEQHRQEVLTKKGDRPVGLENVEPRPLAVMSPSGLFSWGTQNSPEMLLRRNVVTVLLAAAAMPAPDAVEDRSLDGQPYKFGSATLPTGERVGLYFDPARRRLAAFETTDTEAMLGDVPAQYVLGDYRSAGDVTLPHKITIRKDGRPYADVQFQSISINDGTDDDVFDIPVAADADVDRAIAESEYSPVEIVKVAAGVYFARAYSHHSMVVEFPAWLAVVEAPYTNAQSETLGRLLRQQFPNKPIRYAAITHPHFDHIGGVRGLAAQGATILVEQGHEAVLRRVVESAHTNPADALQRRRQQGESVGAVEVFAGKKVISDGRQSLELHAVTGFPHVDPKVLAYVPSARVLFQSDLFFPGTAGAASPDAVHLLRSVRQLNLRVDTNAGGHGGVAPFAELVKAAAAATETN